MKLGRSTAARVLETVTERAQQAQEMMPPATSLVSRIEEMPDDAWVNAVAGSFVASAILMLLGRERGRHWSLFLGVWAPTILNLAMYRRLRRS